MLLDVFKLNLHLNLRTKKSPLAITWPTLMALAPLVVESELLHELLSPQLVDSRSFSLLFVHPLHPLNFFAVLLLLSCERWCWPWNKVLDLLF